MNHEGRRQLLRNMLCHQTHRLGHPNFGKVGEVAHPMGRKLRTGRSLGFDVMASPLGETARPGCRTDVKASPMSLKRFRPGVSSAGSVGEGKGAGALGFGFG